ncbi:MAG: hypothetical protein FI721_06165 [SAR202 cluster bacterium]|nr:hypothetical protein [SAR202 cluster bacterium]|tara:strand:+ start:8243 stop:9622 length:1380 start_codon:yes stop_codon:yes gene_type:complete
MSISKISGIAGVSLAGMAALLVGIFADIDLQTKVCVIVMMIAVAMWITDWVPAVTTSFFCILLLTFAGGVDSFTEALVGFSKPICYFLIGILAMGFAVRVCGLAERVASYIINLSLGNPVLMYFQMLLSFVLLTFVLPSATTRGAIIVNMYEEVLDSWHVAKTHPFHKMLMMAMLALNRCASTALLAGGITPVVASGLLGDFSWIEWFVIMSVPFYLNLFVGGTILYFWYLKGVRELPVQELNKTSFGPLKPQEIKVIIIISITVILWFTDFIHGFHASVPAVLAFVLLMSPKIGILSWDELQKGIAWSNFFITAAALSLGLAFLDSGGAQWMATSILSYGLQITENPSALLVLVMVLIGLARIAFNNISAYLVIMIPLTMGFASILGFEPIVIGFITVVIGDSVIFYCAGTGSGLIIFERSGLTNMEVFRFACVMMLSVILVAYFIVLPYWSLIGFTA